MQLVQMAPDALRAEFRGDAERRLPIAVTIAILFVSSVVLWGLIVAALMWSGI